MLHDTDSTVGRCNLSICAIDRLVVQVPRIVKEPGMFSLFIVLPFQGRFHYLKCSLFHAFRLETGHSVNHVYFCLLRDGCIYSVHICIYYVVMQVLKTVVPCRHSTTPLLSVTVSYVVITETLFCLTPFPLFLQVIMPRGRRRGRGRGRLAHTDIVSRPEVTLLWIYIAISLGCTSFCIYECCFE